VNTPSFPDVSQWYTPARVAAEEAIWAEGQHYLENVRRIEAICDSQSLATVMEFGCGTGWIPKSLDPSLIYTMGIDNNPHMLALAREKNPGVRFVQADIRRLDALIGTAELTCSFAVLKHFSLTEWPTILRNILFRGRFSLFNQHALPDSREPFDAGTEWHSSWPRRCDILAAVEAAGHEILDWDDSHIDPGVGAPESYITTRRVR
jgi:SAM-dependent methyltransferase